MNEYPGKRALRSQAADHSVTVIRRRLTGCSHRSRPRPVSKFLSGPAYLQALEAIADVIGWLVTENLLEKHIKPVFITDGR